MQDDSHFSPDPVHVPITDVLDLHAFRPKEVPDLLDDYFHACIAAGIHRVRVIHGKGTGVLRSIVHSILERTPAVESYSCGST